MQESTSQDIKKRCAIVTGGNKGIGFEICRQLVCHGITVVLTARDEQRGLDALHRLKHSSSASGDRDLLFHQLDVADSSSIVSLAEFVKNQFGRLDILVNNAGVVGSVVDVGGLKRGIEAGLAGTQSEWKSIMAETYELAAECLDINYYGAKRMVEAFLPLLQSSQCPRIVNVTSSMGRLESISNEWAKAILSDAENLSEERVDEVVKEYLKDFKEGNQETKGWPLAHSLSKASMNAYTRILAKRFPGFKVNCVCPGFVKTDFSFHLGRLTVEEGAQGPVMGSFRLVILSKGTSIFLVITSPYSENKRILGRLFSVSSQSV